MPRTPLPARRAAFGPSRRRATPARRDAAATREALLEAAASLFSERGFDGVPIEDVAARAGVNKALISYHFAGKRGLYVAVLASVFAELSARLKAIEALAGSVPATLHRLLEAFARLRAERPDFPQLFLREVLSRGLEPALVPHLVEIVGVTRRLAERGMREGTFRRVDPFAMHFALVGSLVFFFATEPARRRAASQGQIRFPMPDAKAFVRYLEELTLRGLARERREAPRRRKGAHA
jgi:AcrR family transcriptional regulator